MKILMVVLCFVSSFALAEGLPKCHFPTHIEAQDYGMVHLVEVPNGQCKFLKGALDRFSSGDCSRYAELMKSQCYQETKTKVLSNGQYVGKTYDCWGCLTQKP